MLHKFTEEVFNKIVEYNSRGNHESIPHSDLFEKEVQAIMGLGRADIERIIRILKESHKIFSFEIIKEDKENDIKRVDGYVEADLQTIRKLKNYFQKLLMDEYERQFHNRLLVHQIVKDIYSRPSFYKNTLIGQIANKAIMLEEYEKFIERHYPEYTDSWKSNKLAELLSEAGNKLISEGALAKKESKDGSQVMRAVDSPQYGKFVSDQKKQSLDKVLQIYGAEFFFRINLRKYNFELLRHAVDSGMIDRRSDLQTLKEMIQKMKANTDKDPQLQQLSEKIYKLERSISRQMPLSR